MLYKKRFLFLPGLYVMEIGWTVLDKRAILKRAFIFSQVVLWEIKSSSRESRCLSVRNKVITSFLPRIFSHSIEYPDYLSVCSLKIRKKAIIFSRKQAKRKKKHFSVSGKYFQQKNCASVFNRTTLFLSKGCTIQNTSDRRQTDVRTPFLQNRTQWLLIV